MDKESNQNQLEDYKKVQQAIAYLSNKRSDEIDFYNFACSLALNERQLTDLFKRWCGLSPKSFAQAVALDHAKRLLSEKANILETSNEIGLSSTSRLYDLFITHHAMPPKTWAKKASGLEMTWGVTASPFGMAMLFITKYGLAGLAFFDANKLGDTKEENLAFEDMANRWPNAIFFRNDEKAQSLGRQIFSPDLWGKNNPIRIVLIGTDFEVRVWESLTDIPLGKLNTYGAIAKKIDKPKAARAVGAAIGRNPISFVVPCHRVVGGSGKLTGYHWGIKRKQAMLGWEVGVS